MALSRATRFLTLIFSAIQIAAPALLSVADGAVAAAARSPGSHIEEVGQNPCTPPHSAECGICRFLSTTVGETPVSSTMFVSTELSTPAAVHVAFCSAVDRDGFNSRAPPTLLG